MGIIASVCVGIAIMLFFVQVRLCEVRDELKEMNRLKRMEVQQMTIADRLKQVQLKKQMIANKE